MPKESQEQEYRRGYRDGYISALMAVYGNREIPRRHWNFWQDALAEWQRKEPRGEMILPPEPGK